MSRSFEGIHAAVVAVDHEQGRSGAVDLGVHFEAVDIVILTGRGVVAIRNRLVCWARAAVTKRVDDRKSAAKDFMITAARALGLMYPPILHIERV
jgi:hypothetical protein